MTRICAHPDYLLLRLTLLLALILLIPNGASAEEQMSPDLIPNPELTADDVVRIQLNALANNDTPRPDAGIEITFRFASPDNKKSTGPLPRFIELVKTPVYRPMLNHTDAEFGKSVIQEGHTLLPVILTATDGGKAGYVFILGQQDLDSCQGCWMTESVTRIKFDGVKFTPQDKPEVGI